MSSAATSFDQFEHDSQQAYFRPESSEPVSVETTQRLPRLRLELVEDPEGCDPYNHVGKRLR